MIKTLKVIPLSSSVQKEYLTYFTAKDVEVGTIVTIPVRKKVVDAMIIEVGELVDEKSAIKSATFNLKKISTVKGPSPFGHAFFRATEEASRYFAGTVGAVLDQLIPEYVFNNYSKLTEHKEKEENKNNLIPEKLVLQGQMEDRISFYKTFIRESFAKKKSVFICLPTLKDIELFENALKKGIETYAYTFHSDLTNKQFITAYNNVLKEEHPVLIIATGAFVFIPRHDVGTIVLEHESSGAYKTFRRPYVDIRTFIEIYCHEKKIKFILGDTMLRPETIYRHEIGELGEVAPLSYRLPHEIEQIVVNTKVDEEKSAERKKKKVQFSVLSPEVEKAITKGQERGEKTFLFTLRKGLAPVTICHDCGTTLECDYCANPLVLYPSEEKNKRIYICNTCKKEKSSKVLCKTCGGWNMVPFGIGTDTVTEEVQALFPNAKIIQFDKEHITTEKIAKKAMQEFYETPGAILVGTELALYYLKEQVENVAIISFDSLWSIPSFRIHEKIISLINNLRAYTARKLIIQTKNPDSKLLSAFTDNMLLHFYRDEIKERKMLNYPPFSVLIKITFRGDSSAIEKEKSRMQEVFKSYNLEIVDAFIKKVKGLYSINGIITIPREMWTLPGLTYLGSFDDKLENILKSLPLSYKVQVDPEDLL